MKLSTSRFARGRVGLLAAVLLMALLVAAKIDPNVVCLVGVATWIAVTLLLSVFKDKEVAANAPNPAAVPQPPPSPISLHAAAPPPPGLAPPPSEARPTKNCPYCAEAILSDAIVCRFCGRDLAQQPMPTRELVQSVPHTSTFAVVSLITGIAAWTVLPIIGAFIAVITGHVAKNEIRSSSGRFVGSGLATAGQVLGYLQIILILAVASLTIFSLLGPSIGSVSRLSTSSPAPLATRTNIIRTQIPRTQIPTRNSLPAWAPEGAMSFSTNPLANLGPPPAEGWYCGYACEIQLVDRPGALLFKEGYGAWITFIEKTYCDRNPAGGVIVTMRNELYNPFRQLQGSDICVHLSPYVEQVTLNGVPLPQTRLEISSESQVLWK